MAEALRVPSPSTGNTLIGTVRVFMAESLLIPSGLLMAAYLARRLGPGGYGIFTVAAALVAWIEWSLTAMFARASVKFVADARDWRPIGSTILSVHLFLSIAAALLLWLAAPLLAGFLDTPELPAISVLRCRHPVLHSGPRSTPKHPGGARRLHRSRARRSGPMGQPVGLGRASGRAGAFHRRGHPRQHWRVDDRARGGPGIRAPRDFGTCGAARAAALGYVAPLLLSALALRLYDKLDLVTLTALGGTTQQAGLYAAAQNLSILPSLVAASFSPLLLSALSRASREPGGRLASRLRRDAMRGVVLLVPFAGFVAGSASEIVSLVFGPAFAPAWPLLSMLIFAAVALVQVSVATAILTAEGRPGLTPRLDRAAASPCLDWLPGFDTSVGSSGGSPGDLRVRSTRGMGCRTHSSPLVSGASADRVGAPKHPALRGGICRG